jgi:hypothetical protein
MKYNAMLVHNKTIPLDIIHNPSSWWWKYDIVFDCYWGERNQDNFNRNNSSVGSKIEDEITLRKIELDLKRYLALGIDTLNLFRIQEASHGLLALSQEDPRKSDTPFKDHRITDYPTESPMNVLYDDAETASSDTRSTLVPSTSYHSIGAETNEGGESAMYRSDPSPVDPHLWVRKILLFINSPVDVAHLYIVFSSPGLETLCRIKYVCCDIHWNSSVNAACEPSSKTAITEGALG